MSTRFAPRRKPEAVDSNLVAGTLTALPELSSELDVVVDFRGVRPATELRVEPADLVLEAASFDLESFSLGVTLLVVLLCSGVCIGPTGTVVALRSMLVLF